MFSAQILADPVNDMRERVPSFRGVELSSPQAIAIADGEQSWLLDAADEHGNPYVALGTLVRGRFRCSFGLTLATETAAPTGFWAGVDEFTQRHSVTEFWVESFSKSESPGFIPALPNERKRFTGIKLYVLDLLAPNSPDGMASNHRRNIAKAQKNGIELVELPQSDAIAAHARLANSSLSRRKARGEPTGSKVHREEYTLRYLATGKARLYQAALSGSVVSSDLVLVLGEHAHYLTGGTSEDGMRLGSSYFLMYQIIRALGAAGVKTLNLDVASVKAGGLGRFKEGFGPEILCVERAYCDLKSRVKMVRNFAHHLLPGRPHAASHRS